MYPIILTSSCRRHNTLSVKGENFSKYRKVTKTLGGWGSNHPPPPHPKKKTPKPKPRHRVVLSQYFIRQLNRTDLFTENNYGHVLLWHKRITLEACRYARLGLHFTSRGAVNSSIACDSKRHTSCFVHAVS